VKNKYNKKPYNGILTKKSQAALNTIGEDQQQRIGEDQYDLEWRKEEVKKKANNRIRRRSVILALCVTQSYEDYVKVKFLYMQL